MSRSARPGLSARWVALRAELDADRPAWWVTRVVGPGDPAGPGGPPAAATGDDRVEAVRTDAAARRPVQRPVQRPANRSQARGSSRSRFVVAVGTTVAVVAGFVLGSLAVQGWAAWTHTESRAGGVRGGVLTLGSDATFATPVTALTAGTSQVGTRYLEVRNAGDVASGAVSLTATVAVGVGPAAAADALDARVAVCAAGWAYQAGSPACSSWTVVSGGWEAIPSLAAVPVSAGLTAGGRVGVRVELRGGLAAAAAADAGIGVDALQGASVTVSWQVDAVARAGCEACA